METGRAAELIVAGAALLLVSVVNFLGVLPTRAATATLASVALVVFSVFLYRTGFARGRESVSATVRKEKSN